MGSDLKTELQRLHSRLNALLMAGDNPLASNPMASTLYQDIKLFFQEVRDNGKGIVFSCTTGEEESSLVIKLVQGGYTQTTKVVVTKDLTCQKFTEISSGKWETIRNPTQISSMQDIKNVIGGCGAWNILDIISSKEFEKRSNGT
jgi:hypothetical protein